MNDAPRAMLVVSALASGCAEPSDTTTSPPLASCLMSEQPLVEGEFVTVAPDYLNEVCAGTMEHMDVFVARLMERFQIDDADLSICFAWKNTLEEVDELCDSPVPVVGCAEGQSTVSAYAPNDHELVHNVTSLIGRPPVFFVEGAAVAHEGYDGLLNKVHNKGFDKNPIDYMEMSRAEFGMVPDGVGYEVAGRFTGYLMAVYGMDAYIRFYRSLERDADLARIDEVFQDALGVTLDESVAEYLDGWSACWADPLLIECNAPEVAWDGEILQYEENVDCAKGDAIGTYEYESYFGRVVVQRTITITEDAMYELRLAGDTQEPSEFPDVAPLGNYPEHGVSLRGCAPCNNSYMETTARGYPRLAHLKPGKYALGLHGYRFEPGPVAFTLKKVE